MKTMEAEMIKIRLDFFIKQFYNSLYFQIDPLFEEMIKKLEMIEIFFYTKKDFNLKWELRKYKMILIKVCEPCDPMITDFNQFVKSL
jgi:hypothetical protein